MDLDDIVVSPAPQKPKFEDMSVDELTALIAELEGEIAQAREMMATKQTVRGAADQLFD